MQRERGVDPDCLRGQADRIAAILKMFTHPGRMLVLWQLSQREMCVGELEEQLQIRQDALSHHLATLRGEGLVSARREGRHVFYRGTSDPVLRGLVAFLYRTYADGRAPG